VRGRDGNVPVYSARQFDTWLKPKSSFGMGAGGRKQGFIAGVVVDHEMALPIA